MTRQQMITERLLKGQDSLSRLRQQFNDSAVNKAVARLATCDPAAFDLRFGAPAHSFKILTDANLGLGLTEPVHRLFGRVSVLAYLAKTGLKDPQLYAMADEGGYDAILTCDANLDHQSDLCRHAQKTFTYKETYGPDEAPPGIIILPVAKAAEQERVLSDQRERVLVYLSSRTAPTLDLRHA